MTTFTLTDLAHRSGEVAQAAHRGPVDITNRGKRAFVLVAADQYDALSRPKSDVRRAVHVDDLTAEEAEYYASALEAAAKALEND